MSEDIKGNSSSEESTNECKQNPHLRLNFCSADFKNPMKRRIHDIQKLNLQNKEMLMVSEETPFKVTHGLVRVADGWSKQKVGLVNYPTEEPKLDHSKHLDEELRKYFPMRVYEYESVPQLRHADCIQRLV